MHLYVEMEDRLERSKRIEREALRAVREGRVIKVVFEPSGRTFWLVYGRKFKRTYLVIPRLYCSCRDFLVNVFLRGRASECYHMRARDIAEREGLYREKTLPDSELENFLRELYHSILAI